MRNFRNNFRRSRYKNHSDRNNHKNENGSKIINDLQNGSNFIRKNSNRNNHNASKLVEKYSNLAKEALSNGDKILSENYYQHAEHFIRVLEERQGLKIGCPEEIAYRQKFISEGQLGELAKKQKNSGYGQYLLGLLRS